MTTKANKVEQVFQVNSSVSRQRVQDMLVGAFEGGSNYWYRIYGNELAPGLTYADFKAGGKMQDPDQYYHPSQIIPLTPGCKLIIEDMEDDDNRHELTLDSLSKGLQVMCHKFPKHFADMISENDDANTADCFLQCCVFGDMIYG